MPDFITNILREYPNLIYLVLLVWTFLEGETIVIIVGVMARAEEGPFLPLVILCSFCGSLCSDQLVFFLGRYKGKSLLPKHPKWQARAERVYRLLEKHQNWLILGFRFLYGLRNITPFAIGMSEVKTRKFVLLNVIGAAVWATTFACGGYVFGAAMETFAKDQKWTIITVLLVLALAAWVFRMYRKRKAARASLTTNPQTLDGDASIPSASRESRDNTNP